MSGKDSAQDFIIPDYRRGSIVNLMASIIQCFGGKSLYKPLKSLVPDEIRQYENVVLMIIDGLGQEYLTANGQQTFFANHHQDTMTSVFPATTATAITTFMTGLAPQLVRWPALL